MSDRPANGPARTGATGEHACDVLVIGSGAGGLTAAITARLHGLDVLVVEFYAVRILPGSLGTFAGLRTDARARVLAKDGRPIGGLHAVGSDMASIMGGQYPAGGITLGPAMTFGYIAGLHLAGQLAEASAGELDAVL